MRLSLLISTYERPDALATVLRSVRRQSRLPDEVVIGDDGSGPETAAVIKKAVDDGLPVRHVWHPHDGFRLGRSRNGCIAGSGGDYLVFIDDDILLHPDFLADHETAAKKGFFTQGTRALLDEAASRKALAADAYWPGLFEPGIGNRKNTIRSPWLARQCLREAQGIKGIRTCNFAVWRDDCVRVNGFNEEFVGWGREDSEFVTRLMNAGVRRQNIRFAALGCHLYHPPRSRDGLDRNDSLLAKTVEAGAVRCEQGLNLHTHQSAQGYQLFN